MMTSVECFEKSVLCEAWAGRCHDAEEAASWLQMAGEWRALGNDGDSQGTLARLMRRKRTAP